MEIRSRILVFILVSLFTPSIAFPNTCPPPEMLDKSISISEEELPVESGFQKYTNLLAPNNNALFWGTLKAGGLGPIEQRSEVVWIERVRQERQLHSFRGETIVFVDDAYLFDGSIITSHNWTDIVDAPVRFKISCLEDATSQCSSLFPVNQLIVFGGRLYNQGGIQIFVESKICPNYLVESAPVDERSIQHIFR